MGLDMYLTYRAYVKDLAPEIGYTEPGYLGPMPKEDLKATSVTFEVAYWRKANAIHRWFVENCADGRDECQEIEVRPDDLRELKVACQLVIDDPALCVELLPTGSGFFFGSTDYDVWYFDALRYTVDVLDSIEYLFDSNRGYFVYQSSW